MEMDSNLTIYCTKQYYCHVLFVYFCRVGVTWISFFSGWQCMHALVFHSMSSDMAAN